MNKEHPNIGLTAKIKDYVRVSPQLHLMTAGYVAFVGLDKILGTNLQPPLSINAAFAGFFFADFHKAYNNLKDFYRVKHDFEEKGWDERLAEPFMKTFCGRYAVRTAAIDLGYKEEVKNFYKENGHSWFKICW